MERRQRRSFTDDYERQAVDLVASSGRCLSPPIGQSRSQHRSLPADYRCFYYPSLPLDRPRRL